MKTFLRLGRDLPWLSAEGLYGDPFLFPLYGLYIEREKRDSKESSGEDIVSIVALRA